MLTFNKKYFILAVALFIIEVLIAGYVRDGFVRPYVGDFLVVMLIYCAVKTFLNAASTKAAFGVLLFAYLIEFMQYLQLVEFLGLQNNTIARVVIGYQFEWLDMLAYTLGIITILLLEKRKPRLVS